MSHFDRISRTDYVEGLRVFLKMKKQDFLDKAGLNAGRQKRLGRLPVYPEEAIRALEVEVNKKAARCEATDTTLIERFHLARDYAGLNDSDVARGLGVSREYVRQWGLGVGRPTDLAKLAEVVRAPLAWLERGGEENLPANSHIGVRVGDESKKYRETLFGMTTQLVVEMPDTADLGQAQAFIERRVFDTPELAKIARRAGGRWQVAGGKLLFSPWIYLSDYTGLRRRFWTDEVEKIIQEELVNSDSVYGAWSAMERRCKELGLTEYPQRITLHKRVEKEKALQERFGIDLNEMVAASLAANP